MLLEPFYPSAAEAAVSDAHAEAQAEAQAQAEAHAAEMDLFSRIKDLESQLAHGLPPQLNQGDYERLVQENLANSLNVHQYRTRLSNELFELQIMELKVKLQNLIYNGMVC